MRGWVTIAIAIMAFSGCSPEIGTPEGAYRLYLNSLTHGRLTEAYELLDSASRDAISPAEFAKRMGFREAGVTPMTPETVELAHPRRKALEGNLADVDVDLPGGGTATIRMVREGAGWKVRLRLPN